MTEFFVIVLAIIANHCIPLTEGTVQSQFPGMLDRARRGNMKSRPHGRLYVFSFIDYTWPLRSRYECAIYSNAASIAALNKAPVNEMVTSVKKN